MKPRGQLLPPARCWFELPRPESHDGTRSFDGEIMMTSSRFARYSSLFLRLALGASFLSAVADRFGLWGSYGQPHVAWGNFSRFVQYTGQLNWFLPHVFSKPLAWISTVLEAVLGVLLILGLYPRIVAL